MRDARLQLVNRALRSSVRQPHRLARRLLGMTGRKPAGRGAFLADRPLASSSGRAPDRWLAVWMLRKPRAVRACHRGSERDQRIGLGVRHRLAASDRRGADPPDPQRFYRHGRGAARQPGQRRRLRAGRGDRAGHHPVDAGQCRVRPVFVHLLGPGLRHPDGPGHPDPGAGPRRHRGPPADRGSAELDHRAGPRLRRQRPGHARAADRGARGRHPGR